MSVGRAMRVSSFFCSCVIWNAATDTPRAAAQHESHAAPTSIMYLTILEADPSRAVMNVPDYLRKFAH